MEVPALLIGVPTYDSTGAKNRILFTDTLDQSFFTALLNQSDASKRWNPTPRLKNVSDKRDDATFFTFDDQTVEFIHEGARKFNGWFTNESGKGATAPRMKKQIESIRCSDGYSWWIVTLTNQLIGQLSDDGLGIEPIMIDEQSILAGLMKKTNAEPQYIFLQFNWSALAKDEDLAMFDCDELGGANLTTAKALLDICSELEESTQTTLKIKLKSYFGTPSNPDVLKGLVVTDFKSSQTGTPSKIWNETDQADVTITSVTESPDGTYELAFASQDVGDVLVPYAEKTGYDLTCVKENPIDVES